MGQAYTVDVADYARIFSLGARRTGDESGVTSDWRTALADVVDQATHFIAVASDDDRTLGRLAGEFLRTARLDREADSLRVDSGAVSQLSVIAATIRAGRRRGIRSLAFSVKALLALARQTGAAVQLPHRVTGAVALYGATSAPLERRAVVSRHTVRATDAGWEFGRGSVVEGPALGIVAFLMGESEEPPRRAIG